MEEYDFDQIQQQFSNYVIGNYAREPVAFVRGDGSQIWDSEGRQYIDLMPGWGTTTIGHCHPAVVSAIREQSARLIHIDNTFYNIPQGVLAEHLSKKAFGGKCFFCNSGAEAIETSLKLARLWGEERGKSDIVTMEGSFHGRTFGAISATGQEKYHTGYVPLLPGIKHVPFNDDVALEQAVDEKTCAVLLELIQGEGGVNLVDIDYLKTAREICNEKGALLLFDEVQTGMGRTGEWFGYQNYNIEPDIMALAKALGGGFPIGAVTAGAEVAESLRPGTHAATFGGNPLACAAATAVFETIEDENLIASGREISTLAFERLQMMKDKYEIIREVRGKGLMIGIELRDQGKEVFEYCLHNLVRVNCTHETVVRLLPAMNIPLDMLHKGLDILAAGIAKAQNGTL